MSEAKESVRRLPSSRWDTLESIIERFEHAWQQQQPPAIDDYLVLAPGASERGALLIELVHTDLEWRIRAGEPARVESYLERYPELAAEVLALVEAEYAARREREQFLAGGKLLAQAQCRQCLFQTEVRGQGRTAVKSS